MGKQLNIPEVNQWDKITASRFRRDCGVACTKMLLDFYFPDNNLTVDQLASETALIYGDLGLTCDQVAELGIAHGLDMQVQHNTTVDQIKAHINFERPVICLIAFRDISEREDQADSKPFTDGHYIIPTGYSDDGHTFINDCDVLYNAAAYGKDVPVKDQELDKALADALPPRQAVVCYGKLVIQVDYPATVNAKGGLYLRFQPSIKASTILVMPDKSPIQVLKNPEQQADGQTWVKVTYDQKIGWCAKSLIVPLSAIPAPSIPPRTIPAGAAYVKPDGAPLHLRVGPSKTYGIQTSLTALTPVTVLADNPVLADQYTWVRVQAAGLTGWVADSYLTAGNPPAPQTYPTGYDLYVGNVVNLASLVADFLLHKVTEGVRWLDTEFLPRRSALPNMPFGAYHFGTGGDVQKQVDHFLASAQVDGRTILILDFEENPDTSVNSEGSMTVQQAADFVAAVHARCGIWPVLYSRASYLNRFPIPAALKNCPLWVANAQTPPVLPVGWNSWTLNQYDQKDGLDVDRFNGSLADFQTFWAKNAPKVVIAPPSPAPAKQKNFVGWFLFDDQPAEFLAMADRLAKANHPIPVVTVLNNAGLAERIKEISPKTVVVFRYEAGNPNATTQAVDWWNHLWPQLCQAPHADYLEFCNEGMEEGTAFVKFYNDLMDIAAQHTINGHPVHITVGDLAEGNGNVGDIQQLLGKIAAGSHILNMHAYSQPTPAGDISMYPDVQDLELRWLPWLKDHPGVKIIFGEAGTGNAWFFGTDRAVARWNEFNAIMQPYSQYIIGGGSWWCAGGGGGYGWEKSRADESFAAYEKMCLSLA